MINKGKRKEESRGDYLFEKMENNLNLSHNILDFKTLTDSIRQLHSEAQARALNAVNKMATLRNWLIGYRPSLSDEFQTSPNELVGKLFSYLLQLTDKKVLENFLIKQNIKEK